MKYKLERFDCIRLTLIDRWLLVQVSVAVRHGKSRLLAVWSLDELQRSNDNLATLDPARARDGRSYILPKGGVKAGLASQFIVLHRLNTPINS